MAEDPTMWRYWKGEYLTPKAAVECQYPETLEKDRVLQAAMGQIEAGELALNARMQQLADEAEDDDVY